MFKMSFFFWHTLYIHNVIVYTRSVIIMTNPSVWKIDFTYAIITMSVRSAYQHILNKNQDTKQTIITENI